MTLEELRQYGETAWAPSVHYTPGDVVLVLRPAPRRWWERLLRLSPCPPVYERYVCVAEDAFEGFATDRRQP